MSEKMRPLSFDKLLDRLLSEYDKAGTVYDLPAPWRAGEADHTLPLFGEKLETPLGPAAGPHTQLAQNIISAYLCGARFFELKTVQKLDGEELAACISRPCIKADDEGYNCEWSTELTVEQAYGEYVKAWVALKIISRLWNLGDPKGFMFNMSVGYDLAGIKLPKLEAFIEGLKDASLRGEFSDCLAIAAQRLPELASYIRAIDPRICRGVTVSTLHGCPPQEIESIASYLLREKGLNTFVKCNPTILGYDFVRRRLDQAGFDYISFDDHHYREDLQWEDALPMFGRLQALAGELGLEFGLKLSNTCPVQAAGELPAAEMYMSGRSLYLLTIEMASRFSAAFQGRLRLSYSGGADYFNIKDLFEAGVWPITVATTLLQPGGYGRLQQLADLLYSCEYKPGPAPDPARLAQLSQAAPLQPRHRKPLKAHPAQALEGRPPLLDCFSAPCRQGCPLGQDAPQYLELVAKGEYEAALQLILEKNPLPFITGSICAHHCTDGCTRRFYDTAVDIRGAKLQAAQAAYDRVLPQLKPGPPRAGAPKCAVIGGGPAGLAAAYFLGRAGLPVTLFEKSQRLGGIPAQVIPSFRLSEQAIARDVALIRARGGEFVLGRPAPSYAELQQQGYDYILLACGAACPVTLDIPGNIIEASEFLALAKAGQAPSLGRQVAVIGGGNSAMDAARAARRAAGVEQVSIVYRRSQKQVPADMEELELAQAEGVRLLELLTPLAQSQGLLQCRVMRLGPADESGRRRPLPTPDVCVLPADTLIAALGARPDPDLLAAYGVDITAATPLPLRCGRTFLLGDARRGPATVAEAISDAAEACREIIGAAHAYTIPDLAYGDEAGQRAKRCRLSSPLACDGERCLACDSLCENCVSVCPNRANTEIRLKDGSRQVLHVDRFCNECGNCADFCPYQGAPYQDKFTLFTSQEDFADSKNEGFLVLSSQGPRVRLRLAGQVVDMDLSDAQAADDLDRGLAELMLAVVREHAYLL